MSRSVIAMIVLAASANSARAEDLENPVSTNSRWDLTFAVGASSSSTAMPGMQLMGAQTRAETDTASTSLEASGLFSLRYRIGERIEWSIPTLSFAYLGGTPGEREWIPWAGLTSWGAGYSSIEHLVLQGSLGAGAGVREWLTPAAAVNVTADVGSQFRYTSSPVCDTSMMCRPQWVAPDTWRGTITAGTSLRLGNAWTFNVAAGASQQLFESGTSVSLGSIQTIGLRTLPLVEARISRNWSADGYAMAAYNLSLERWEQTYLVGLTRYWPN